ncbi:hypothetical protein ILUMI_14049, partial [Ignelater luminosus]
MPSSREEWRKPLSQKELEEAILHLLESKDDLEIFSDDDDDLNFDKNVLITHVTADSDENIDFELPNIENIDIENIPIIFEDQVIPSSTSLPNMLENLEPEQAYVYNFEVYTDQENDSERRGENETDLGACANVVIRLLRNVPQNINHRVYFDNYYTALPLTIQLAKRGILALGTVRSNRISNCPLPSEKELLKLSRGTSYEFLTTVDTIDTTTVACKDNK